MKWWRTLRPVWIVVQANWLMLLVLTIAWLSAEALVAGVTGCAAAETCPATYAEEGMER